MQKKSYSLNIAQNLNELSVKANTDGRELSRNKIWHNQMHSAPHKFKITVMPQKNLHTWGKLQEGFDKLTPTNKNLD